jgi:hypothetical protein
MDVYILCTKIFSIIGYLRIFYVTTLLTALIEASRGTPILDVVITLLKLFGLYLSLVEPLYGHTLWMWY